MHIPLTQEVSLDQMISAFLTVEQNIRKREKEINLSNITIQKMYGLDSSGEERELKTRIPRIEVYQAIEKYIAPQHRISVKHTLDKQFPHGEWEGYFPKEEIVTSFFNVLRPYFKTEQHKQ